MMFSVENSYQTASILTSVTSIQKYKTLNQFLLFIHPTEFLAGCDVPVYRVHPADGVIWHIQNSNNFKWDRPTHFLKTSNRHRWGNSLIDKNNIQKGGTFWH